MPFAAPLPFAEALDSFAAREVLPTALRHRFMSALSPQLKARSFWSAGVSNVEVTQKLHDGIAEILAGEKDQATVTAGIQRLLMQLNYQPAEENRGTLLDLSSDARLNLIFGTNADLAAGFGQKAEGADPTVLDAWPAQELYRAIQTRHPREWAERWAQVGGMFPGGRMIALKDDPIWAELGSSENFDDALDVDYPPFAFNSGMRVRDISRAEAIELRLIDRDTQVQPPELDFNAGLAASPGLTTPALRESLLGSLLDAGIRAVFHEGVLRLAG